MSGNGKNSFESALILALLFVYISSASSRSDCGSPTFLCRNTKLRTSFTAASEARSAFPAAFPLCRRTGRKYLSFHIFSLQSLRNGKSSVFSTQLKGFNISRSFRTSSSVSLMPGVITCRIITLFFAFSHSARNASGAERLTPMYFLYRSSRENFMSSKTISVLPRSFLRCHSL